jgi:hypothetical protein
MPLRAKHSCLCKVNLGYKPRDILENVQIKVLTLKLLFKLSILPNESEQGGELKVHKITR